MKQKMTMQQSVFWNTFGNTIYLVAQWFTTVLVIKFLTPEDNGIFSIALNITNLFIAFAGYGMRNFQISDKKKEYSNGTYIYSRVLTSILATLLLTIFLYFNNYSLYTKLVVLAYMLYKFTELFFDVYSAIFQSEWRMDLIGKSMLIRSVVTLVTFTGALIISRNLLVSIFILTIFTFLSLLLYDIKALHKLTTIKLNTNKIAVTKLLKVCFPLAAYALLLSATATIPKYILEQTTDAVTFGIYAAVSNPTIFVQAFAITFFTPFLSLFTNHYHDSKIADFWKLLLYCGLILITLTISGIIFVQFFGVFFLELLYTPTIAKYSALLPPLIICAALNALSWLLSGLLVIIRQNKVLLLINTAGTLFCIVISLMIIPQYNMMGTAIAYGVTLTIINILLFGSLYINMKKNKNNIGEILND